MNRTLVAIAALLSLGAATHAAAQAQTQPVVTPPSPPVGAAGSLTTRGTVTGRITQTADTTGGLAQPAHQAIDIASAVALSGASGQIDTRGTLVGSVTQTREAGFGSPQNSQRVRLGSVHGFVQAATVRTNALVQGEILQGARTQQAGQGNIAATQSFDVGSVENASGQSLVTSVAVDGNMVQLQDRAFRQEARLASIRDSAVQDARAEAALQGTVTQTDFVGTGSGPNGTQALTMGTIDGVRAQAVHARGFLLGDIAQAQTGRAQQRIDVGSALGTGANPPAGSIRTFASVADVSQFTNGHGAQTVAVARVFDSSAVNADTSGLVSGAITQTSLGFVAGGNQFIGVGNVEGGRGNVVTDAVVDATLTQTRSGSSGAPTHQTMGIGSARATTGVVHTRARVSGSISQVATAASNVEQKIEIGSVVGTGANVSTDAQLEGDILQSNNGLPNQRQTIRIGSVSAAD